MCVSSQMKNVDLRIKLINDNRKIISDLEYWRKLLNDDEYKEMALKTITILNDLYRHNLGLIKRLKDVNLTKQV